MSYYVLKLYGEGDVHISELLIDNIVLAISNPTVKHPDNPYLRTENNIIYEPTITWNKFNEAHKLWKEQDVKKTQPIKVLSDRNQNTILVQY